MTHTDIEIEGDRQDFLREEALKETIETSDSPLTVLYAAKKLGAIKYPDLANSWALGYLASKVAFQNRDLAKEKG